MRLIVVLLLTSSALAGPHYRFDPQSLTKTEYDAKDCRSEGGTTFCKKAYLTFGAITAAERDTFPTLTPSASFVAPTSTGPVWIVHFSPAKCSREPDRRGRYTCRDVSWWLRK